MNCIRFGLVCLFTCFSLFTFCQNAKTDSFQKLISSASTDSTKVDLINQLARSLQSSAPEESLKYAKEAGDLAIKIKYEKGKALAFKTQGLYYFFKSEYPEAEELWNQSIHAYTTIGDQDGMANMLNNMGSIHYSMSNYGRALEFYLPGLEAAEKSGNKLRMATVLNNIGTCYMDKPATYNEAIRYFKKALAISEEINDQQNIGSAHVNMGETYMNMNMDSVALENLQKARFALIDNGENLPYVLNKIGEIYNRRKNYEMASDYYQQSLKKAEEMGNKIFVVQATLNIADMYRVKGQNELALEFFRKANTMAEEIKVIKELRTSFDGLAATYGQLNDYRNAYLYQLKSSKLIDSLNKLQSDSIQRRFEVGIKKKEIDLLTKDKDLQNLELNRQKIVRNALMGGLIMLVLIAIMIYRSYRAKAKTNRLLDSQKLEIEGLLSNILPTEVAKELQENGHATPRYYDSVSVLFTDFKGFTRIADSLSPQQVVAELSECFTGFDNIIEKYGLERIKTIGDAYMCAGGIPTVDTVHPKNTIRAAFEILDYVEKMNVKIVAANGLPWEIRIGINTGPVVAGVVGKKKYAYDIWGSTVNIASRMESNGLPGQVNISAALYEIVKDDFDCEYRGKIYAKNVGEIDMYFVKNPPLPDA